MTIALSSPDLAPSASRRRGAAWAERNRPALTAAAAVTLLTLVQFGLILWQLGGHFSYSLDDPYIHLALADRIAQGHYGLNAGEAAAPSSSILFPVLLAGLSFTGLGQYACLAIGFAASLWSGILIADLLGRSLTPAVPSRMASTLIIVSLILSFNLIGLAFTGLEHSLHVALTLACLLGALRLLQTGTLAPWWWLCALAEPLVRYEGASLWVGMACLMLYRGRLAAGLGLLGAGAVLLGLFSLFLLQLGLPPLPSSVLVKSYVAAVGAGGVSAGLIDGFMAMLAESLTSFGMIRLLILCGLLVALLAGRPRLDDERRPVARPLAAMALFASLGHMLLGRFGWFSRYEIYVVAFDVMVLVYGCGPLLGRLLAGATPARIVIVALCPMAFLSAYPQTTARTAAAARNIYDQQYQMHRFVDAFYRQPVGVNDLGWVAYRSPTYTLDFWGLGSEEARRHRFADPTPRWMDDLARRHGAGLAMIYADWFDRLPEGWQAIARLSFTAPRVTASSDTVTFYATRPEARPAIEAALESFAPTLPPGTALEMLHGP